MNLSFKKTSKKAWNWNVMKSQSTFLAWKSWKGKKFVTLWGALQIYKGVIRMEEKWDLLLEERAKRWRRSDGWGKRRVGIYAEFHENIGTDRDTRQNTQQCVLERERDEMRRQVKLSFGLWLADQKVAEENDFDKWCRKIKVPYLFIVGIFRFYCGWVIFLPSNFYTNVEKHFLHLMPYSFSICTKFIVQSSNQLQSRSKSAATKLNYKSSNAQIFLKIVMFIFMNIIVIV